MAFDPYSFPHGGVVVAREGVHPDGLQYLSELTSRPEAPFFLAPESALQRQ